MGGRTEVTATRRMYHHVPPYTTSHRSGLARSWQTRGYMRALERGFAADVWRAIRLSRLQFFSKLLDTGRSDRRFPSRFENLRPTSTSTSGFPTGRQPLHLASIGRYRPQDCLIAPNPVACTSTINILFSMVRRRFK